MPMIEGRLRSRIRAALTGAAILLPVLVGSIASSPATVGASSFTFDINTLAGKQAAVSAANPSLQISAFVEDDWATTDAAPGDPTPTSSVITPTYVLSSKLDGKTITAPAVTVNQDVHAAPQNETAIAVDPNNAKRVVVGSNDYVTRTWSCSVGTTPCSRLGDGYSGTNYSNDGGATWCCKSTDPSHIGSLIPGVEHLTGGPYDAGGDPAVTFDSRGNVYYAGLGFDRLSAPNTVTVSKGTFAGSGALTWGAPSFINPTTSPSTFNDKEWIAADANQGSVFRDRVYLTWTRFIFDAATGAYIQSPIFEAHSADQGATWSGPQLIGAPVLYGQGSRPVVGPDGTVYVFWDGSTRSASLDSIYMVKSTDGGVTWSSPTAVSPLVDIIPVKNAKFRVNSFPAAAAAPDGSLSVAWSSQTSDTSGGLCPTATNTGCHAAALFSQSSDGGGTWSPPTPIFAALDALNRTAIGYPAPDGLTAPAARRVDTFWPGVAITPTGTVYMSAYAADVVSPWQTCATPASPTVVGRINCLLLGPYINNARLDYHVTDMSHPRVVSTHPINTRSQFGGGFIGDYTGLAVGSDGKFHAVWTDTNNKQTVTWFYGYQFVPTVINQEDAATASGS